MSRAEDGPRPQRCRSKTFLKVRPTVAAAAIKGQVSRATRAVTEFAHFHVRDAERVGECPLPTFFPPSFSPINSQVMYSDNIIVPDTALQSVLFDL